MFTQRYAMNGEQIDSLILPEVLESLVSSERTIDMYYAHEDNFKGLCGVDMDTGLVEIQLSKDKKATMKIGKYLRKIGRSEDVCREYSAELNAAIEIIKGTELSFTTCGSEAVKVYENGPDSCMSKCKGVAIYDGNDTAVAYVKLNDRIIARSVVVINKDLGLRYIEIYGNSEMMQPLLDRAGFVKGDLDGCTFPKLEDDRGILFPYFDCGTYVDIYDYYLKADSSGELDSQITGGYIESAICDRCGDNIVNEYEARYCEHTNMNLCEHCYDEDHVCIDGEYYHKESDDICPVDGEYMFKSDCIYIETREEWMHNDDVAYSEYTQEYIACEDSVDALTRVHDAEGEPCHRDDCTKYEGVWVHDDILYEYEESLDQQSELSE